MKTISITTASFAEYNRVPLEILKKGGFKIQLNPHRRKLQYEEILKLCKDSVGVLAGTETLDLKILSKLPSLRVISRCGAGLDNIDLDAAEKLGIKVFNTPNAPTQSVAELTVGLMLNLMRKIHQIHMLVRNKKWERKIGNLLFGKKIGIIGFGRIGRKVVELLKPFECKIAYNDPFAKARLRGLKRMSKNELLRWSDIISVHVSTNEKLLGAKEFKIMKKEAWLINTSRGRIIDEDALYRALRKGYLAGAALDVFEEEPYNGKLIKLDNVILTSHIGSYAKEARIEMEIQSVNNLLKGLKEIK